jgi:ATP-dependent DNA helicase PIF1
LKLPSKTDDSLRYPLRQEVDESNRKRLADLPGDIIEFKAQDSGDPRKMAQCIAPAVLHFKINAQVMLLKNLDADLVNGSLGVIIGFAGRGDYRTKNSCEALRSPQRRKVMFMEEAEPLDLKIPFPIVQFSNGKVLLLEFEEWSVELPGK